MDIWAALCSVKVGSCGRKHSFADGFLSYMRLAFSRFSPLRSLAALAIVATVVSPALRAQLPPPAAPVPVWESNLPTYELAYYAR